MQRLRLCENMRALGYAPFYLALASGHFPAAGLDVQLITSPSASRTGTMLLEHQADVSWGGPMRVMQHHAADPDCPLKCFAQVVARDPFVLVGRTPNPTFRFHDLLGLRVAIATEVPTPWLMLQDDLARAGIDPAALARADRPTMEEAAQALLAGEIDVIQVFEPLVDALVSAGSHVWHRFTDRGDIAYTTFYAPLWTLDSNRDACRALVRGMASAQRDFHAADPAAIAAAIHNYFPDLPRPALSRIISTYRAAGLWARTPDLPPTAFVRLKAALLSGGLIARDIPYDHLIDAGLSCADPE